MRPAPSSKDGIIDTGESVEGRKEQLKYLDR
jgi:hypothetical protein